MKTKLSDENRSAQELLPPGSPDGSGIGVNYVDAYIKSLNTTTEDGRTVTCKRKGLKLTFSIGDRQGEALLRRLEHGPDPVQILQEALQEAAQQAGASLVTEDGVHYIEE